MQHGLCRTFVEESRSLSLNRFVIQYRFSVCFASFFFVIISFCRYITSHVKTLEQVKAALPALAHLIHINDEEVLTDACWALSYLSDGVNEKIQAVIESGVCPRLVELLL